MSFFSGCFTGRLGADPLFVTLVLSACFYGYAVLRKVPMALEGLAAVLASMAVIGTTTMKDGLLDPVEPGPLLAPAAILLYLGGRQRNPWNLLRGAACLAAATALAVPLPETAVGGLRSAIFVHLTVLSMLILGAAFTDAAGLTIRRIGAGLVLMLAMAGMLPWFAWDGLPGALPVIYPLFMGILLGLFGHFLGDSWVMGMAAIILGYWVFKFGWSFYRAIRTAIKGFDYLVSGLGFFMVAVIVSLGKSGKLSQWIEGRWGMPGWLKALLPPVPVLESSPAAPAEALPEGPASAGPPEQGPKIE